MINKCRKCGVEHDEHDECQYNLTYQYYLNRLLEKVDKVVNQKYKI